MGIEPYLVDLERRVRRGAAARAEAVRLQGAGEAEQGAARGERLRGRRAASPRSSPAGCVRCAQTGYKGRTGLYEVMPMTDEVRRLILEGARHDELHAASRASRACARSTRPASRRSRRASPRCRRCCACWAARRPLGVLDAGRAARRGVRGVLELVAGQRLQLDAERQLDQAVREPDVLRQQRAVQVGADHVAAVHALEAVAAVVAVAREHAARAALSSGPR